MALKVYWTFRDGHPHGGQKSIETSVTEFYYKNANLSLERLEISPLFNQHDSSLDRHVNAHADLCTPMTRKSCALAMRNAILRNELAGVVK